MGDVVDTGAWAVVVPVKRLALAKTRLTPPGVPDVAAARQALALAMALDTVDAALRCPAVRRVVVVSDDPVAVPALAALGARVVADEPDAGLNPALRHGAAAATADAPGLGVAALSSDLPALRPDELARALAAAAGHPRAVVADAAGTGTTLLTAAPGVPLAASYGAGSLRRHTVAGAAAVDVPGLPGLRRDVDTWADLREAARLGVGRHTREALSTLPADL